MPKWNNCPDSGNVKRFMYDIDTMELTVTFRNGRTYMYVRVPVDIFIGLKQAESKGKYIHANLVNKYEFTQVK